MYIELRDDHDERRHAVKVGARAYLVLRVLDMREWLAESEWGDVPRYEGTVSYVDLETMDATGALQYVGIDDDDDISDIVMVDVMIDYGGCSPVFSTVGTNRRTVEREVRSAARELADPEQLNEVLDTRIVNGLGQTAREYASGVAGINSALARGLQAGDGAASVLATVYGIPTEVQEAVADAPPADWLPYMAGYMAGVGGSAPSEEPDVAPEYRAGYDRGVRVRNGEASPPSWIR